MTEYLRPASGRLSVTDGLRAIAIIAVVFFHVFPAIVPGGFIGVDIFFVVSGFVIALNYLPDLAAGQGGFAAFFQRRIRRLVPAYAAMVVIVSIVAFVLLKPVDLKGYGVGVLAQIAYMQNVAFWMQGDYFSYAYGKPLLHTWSLGVEEQFYLLFPLLILCFRRGWRLGLLALVIIGIGSLVMGMAVAPISPKTVFYLVPFRIWEFVGGIAVALWFSRRTGTASQSIRVATIGFSAGLGMVAVAIIGFDEKALLPGTQSLLAVGGTMLMCALQRDIPAGLRAPFENRAVQHIGKTSYSWYLWHWPIVSFYYIATQRMPTLLPGIAMIVGGYLIGWLSFVWLERGNQQRAWLAGSTRSLALLVCFALLCLGIGGTTIVTNGAMFRYPAVMANLLTAQMDHTDGRCSYWERLRDYRWEICRVGAADGPNGVLLVGDSHAAIARGLLQDIAGGRGIPLFLTKRNCKLTEVETRGDYCSENWWRQVVQGARMRGINRIVVVSLYDRALPERLYETSFARAADSGLPVFLQLSTPQGDWFDPARRIDPEGTALSGDLTVADYAAAHTAQRRAAAAIAKHYHNVSLLDPVPYLCPDGYCQREIGGVPLYSDTHHLTSAGIDRLRPLYLGAPGLFPNGR